MTSEALIQSIASQQAPDGALLSTVHLPSGARVDRNCFVTALVLRELSTLERESAGPLPAALAEVRRRALGFLLRSVYPGHREVFGFYPYRSHPVWIGTVLYPDADDTSVAGLELLRGGLWDPAMVARIVKKYLEPHRATAVNLREPFHRAGVFLTWFGGPVADNVIDLCVNANVIALLAGGGQKGAPGYADAVAMIDDGVRRAEDDAAMLRRLTPYYPSPVELAAALRHAVDAGAVELRDARDRMASVLERGDEQRSFALCSNVTGGIVWTSTVLTEARGLRAGGQPCLA